MPFLDNRLVVSVAQDLSQTVGAYVGTVGGTATSVDLGVVARDMGIGERLMAQFTLTTTVTSGGAATIQFQVITSAADTLTSPVVVGTTAAVALAQLVAGAQFFVPINPDVMNRQAAVLRYLGVQYVIAGATTTAGTGDAGFVKDHYAQREYPSGYTF